MDLQLPDCIVVAAVSTPLRSVFRSAASMGVKIMRTPDAKADMPAFCADCRKLGIRFVSEGKGLDPWEKEHRPGAPAPVGR